MTIDVYESTSFESLWTQFESTIAAPLSSPLAVESIVVPARGWPSVFNRRLATQRGCWAQFRFMLPGQWISETLEQCLGSAKAPRREPDTLTWLIASELPGLLDEPEFGAVRSYLFQPGGGTDPQRLIDLSRCIAGLYDRYLLFRPDLIDAWYRGSDWNVVDISMPPEAAWQSRLWRTITRGEHRHYRSVTAMADDVEETLAANPGGLPERLSYWLVGTVAPAHLRFLEAIGRHSNVGLYVLTPACEYWGDMHGRRQLLRRLREHPQSLRQFCNENHVDLLHPLLASLGELSRQQQMLMVDLDSAPWQFSDLSVLSLLPQGGEGGRRPDEGALKTPNVEQVPPHPDLLPPQGERGLQLVSPGKLRATLLNELQNDIRDAVEPVIRQLPRDSSVRIHSCHSAIREVEVLHDRIREALEEEETLSPDEIVVCCPDLDSYAPLVQAVFGQTRQGALGHIPFQIAGRSPMLTRPVIDAWRRLLDVLESRFSTSAVLDLLSTDVIRSRAGLETGDVELLTKWVQDAQIRWGIDAEHRRSEGLPDSDLNTWEFGLDRLLLGYAMPPAANELVGNVATLDRVEGLAAAELGRLCDFNSRLSDWRERTRQDRTLSDWQGLFGRIAREFLTIEDDEAGYQLVLDAAATVATLSADGGFNTPVPFAVAVREVTRRFEEASLSASFRPGGVIFCSPEAMRSLPFRVVCLLGMNDGVFPRGDRSVGFDLMRHKWELGDSRPRDEDRHLFLESVLAAGDRLIITCQGQDVRDQRPKPPSVLVQELLDVLVQSDDPESLLPLGGEGGRRPDEGAQESADDEHTSPQGKKEPMSAVKADLRHWLFVRHPLQAFSPKYFDGDDERLSSYDEAGRLAAERLMEPPQATPVFASTPLDPAVATNGGSADELAVVPLRELRTLLEAPWKLFLERLGVHRLSLEEAGHDREPLVLDNLEGWQAGDEWLQRALAGESDESIARAMCREGTLPGGSRGEALERELRRTVRRIIFDMESSGLTGTTEKLPVHLTVGDSVVEGDVTDWTSDGIRRGVYSKVREKYSARLWLDQVVASAVREQPTGAAVLVGREGTKAGIHSIDSAEARTTVERLVRLHSIACRFPLPFFIDEPVLKPILAEENSKAFKVDFDNQSLTEEYIARVRGRFRKDPQKGRTALQETPEVRLAFAGREPFEMTCREVPELADNGETNLFVYLAQQICIPLSEHLERSPKKSSDRGGGRV